MSCDISGNADSVAELAVYFMIGLSRNAAMMKKGLEKRIMGGPVDYRAMKSALKEKIIAGAGLDVFWEEPPDPADDIFKYNIMAPHIGGATDVSIQGIAESVAENINLIAKGKIPVNQAFVSSISCY